MDAQSQWTGLDAGRLERIGEHLERNYIANGKIAGCQVQRRPARPHRLRQVASA